MTRNLSLLLCLVLAACATKPPAGPSPARLEILELADETFGRTRKLRVWLPEGYDEAQGDYPVLYMFDGQNLFDAALSEYSGAEWEADETAAELIASGVIPPLIIVGIDNAGIHRAEEYLPLGEKLVGLSDDDVRGHDLDDFFTEDVFPFIEDRYRASPEGRGLGGSSFGGVATLTVAMDAPGLFSRLLVESPSLWIADMRMMEELEKSPADLWPEKVYMAMGTQEITGTCPAAPKERDEQMVELLIRAETALRAKGLGEDRLMTVIDECAIHSEIDWAKRFPGALTFLYGLTP